MSDEQDYSNNKSSNKKHLRKQIEAQKRAKKDKNDEDIEENEDEEEEDDDENNENNENNENKDNDKNKDDDNDDEESDDEDDKKSNSKNVKELSKLNISNESSSVFGNTSSVFGNTSSVFGNTSSVFGNTNLNSNSNSLFANTNLNSPFSGVETIQDNFGFNTQVTEFDQELENEIHIYKLLNRKKSNHFNTVIKGLKYLGDKELKELLSKMKKKFGIGGHIGMMEDIDEKEEILFLQGNYSEKVMAFLIKELKRAECYFVLHD
jgi:translation initiation factor 1 (eIF-1/SUI1)